MILQHRRFKIALGIIGLGAVSLETSGCSPSTTALAAYAAQHQADATRRVFDIPADQLQRIVLTEKLAFKWSSGDTATLESTANPDGTITLGFRNGLDVSRAQLVIRPRGPKAEAVIVGCNWDFGLKRNVFLDNGILDAIAERVQAPRDPTLEPVAGPSTSLSPRCLDQDSLDHALNAEEAAFQEAAKAGSVSELPEKAHKYSVQARFAVKQNRFNDAIAFYGKALALAPSWPGGHYNRALVLSMMECFPEASREMKRYLKLSPEAPDARQVQDRIYEWESAK